MNNTVLPYGVSDIKPIKEIEHCCPIIGCDTAIAVYPSRANPHNNESNYCVKHRIYCRKNTYIFKEKTDNLITDINLFKDIFGRQDSEKYDTGRIGYENSEDALSWNVFVTLQKAGELKAIPSLISGKPCEEEPELILWGYSLSDGSLVKELKCFRDKFEYSIQVKTEPDIILKTANEVFLIEAKFCSPNSRKDISVWRDKEIDGRTKKEYDSYKIRYKGLIGDVLNKGIIEGQDKFCSQLVRYALYAHNAYPSKNCYIVNLLPKKHKELDSIEGQFKPYLKKDTFKVITWEDIYGKLSDSKSKPGIVTLKRYLQRKTANFEKAFIIPIFAP